MWLVGAGPSDAGLFTLKGHQVLTDAEVVVYDALVGPAILAMIPDTAEAINVGKRSSNHTMRQEQISGAARRKGKGRKAGRALKGRRSVPVRARWRGTRSTDPGGDII